MISPYTAGFFQVFQPRSKITVSEWAERHRVLPKEGSAAPGPWRNDRAPYLVEIMDVLSASSPVKEVVFAKGSQIGATEAGLNWLMYLIDFVGGPILALQPTDDNASEWSKQRVNPSLLKCKKIRDKMQPAKSRDSDNTILEKGFVGGRLFLSGTNTPNALAGKPIGNIYGDEVDRWPVDVGGEGDPISLVKRRTATYSRAKKFFSSSPALLRSSRIWPLYLESDQRVYEVPCPHCEHYQELTFDRLVWDREHPGDVQLCCVDCNELVPEYHKTTMLAAGRWRAKKPGHWRVGFHLSALYSPIGWLSWAEVIRTFIEAEGDTVKMQVFVNTILGLPWEEDAETIAADYLARRVETYKAQVPMGVLALTMSVDVQNDRLEFEIVGWGVGEESWGIEVRVIPGDPSILKSGDPHNPSVWEQLDDYRRRTFEHEDGGDIRICCTTIDSGGSFTDVVYQYAKERFREKVYAIKGGSQPGKPLMNKAVRAGKCRAWLFVLGVNKGKDLVFTRLKNDAPGPGYCHFPDDENRGYDATYYAGLISEKKRERRRNGIREVVWELPKGARNEPFDLRVYNTAAIRIRNPNWEKLLEQRTAMAGRGGGGWKAALPAPHSTSATPVSRTPAPARRIPGVTIVKA